MSERTVDEKQAEENTEIVKEADNPKRNYIFQKTGITKTAFWIIVVFLVLIFIGLFVSGMIFESPATNP